MPPLCEEHNRYYTRQSDGHWRCPVCVAFNQENKMDTERVTTQQLLNRHRIARNAILNLNQPERFQQALRDLGEDIDHLTVCAERDTKAKIG